MNGITHRFYRRDKFATSIFIEAYQSLGEALRELGMAERAKELFETLISMDHYREVYKELLEVNKF